MLRKFRVGLLLSFAMSAALITMQSGAAQEVKDVKGDPSVERMRKDLFFLASEECEGRGVGTLGLDLAAHYVAAQFKKMGLKPAGPNGSYFQSFPFARGGKLDGESTLTITGPNNKKFELKQGVDFQVIGTSAPGKVSAPLAFVGYGVTAKGIAYDDYAGVDAKGKVVIALRRLPNWNNKEKPFDGTFKDSLAGLDIKQSRAAAARAAAVVLVNDATESEKDGLISFQGSNAISTLTTPYVQIKRSVVDEILKASTESGLEATEKAIDAELKPRNAALPGWTIDLDVKVKRTTEFTVKNVIGYIEGKGDLADETVVVGAHYDHVGYGNMGGSLSGIKNKIHFGADDNASGTTTMIELARRYASSKKPDGRRMVFMAFTAEEMGLIGSRHYTQIDPIFPLKNTTAMFNLDMVGKLSPRLLKIDDRVITLADEDGKETGRLTLADGCKFYRQDKGVKEEIKDGEKAELFKKIPAKGLSTMLVRNVKDGKVTSLTVSNEPLLLVEGFNTAKEFDELVTKLNPNFDIVKKNSRGFVASDQYNFYLQKIPVVFFWTGEHPDYHRPTDVPEKINIAGMKRIADYAERVIDDLRTNPKRPEYTAVTTKITPGTKKGGAARLNLKPDYDFQGKGVLVEEVTEGGAAALAGLKKGDIIIEIAGKATPSLEAYTIALAGVKADTTIELKVLRDKKELTLKATPK